MLDFCQDNFIIKEAVTDVFHNNSKHSEVCDPYTVTKKNCARHIKLSTLTKFGVHNTHSSSSSVPNKSVAYVYKKNPTILRVL